MGGEDLLLEAADGQDLAAEADLARHGNVGVDARLCHERDEGRQDGDARARAVLADRALGHVQVDVALGRAAEDNVGLGRGDPERKRVGAQVRDGDRDRLLDDVAELARRLDRALTGHDLRGREGREGQPTAAPRRQGRRGKQTVISIGMSAPAPLPV